MLTTYMILICLVRGRGGRGSDWEGEAFFVYICFGFCERVYRERKMIFGLKPKSGYIVK